MRGYFAIGVERISKALNIGNLFRSAHAFGASFVFTIDAQYKRHEGSRSDTSDTLGQLPFYSFPNLTSMILPEACSIVGVEPGGVRRRADSVRGAQGPAGSAEERRCARLDVRTVRPGAQLQPVRMAARRPEGQDPAATRPNARAPDARRRSLEFGCMLAHRRGDFFRPVLADVVDDTASVRRDV